MKKDEVIVLTTLGVAGAIIYYFAAKATAASDEPPRVMPPEFPLPHAPPPEEPPTEPPTPPPVVYPTVENPKVFRAAFVVLEWPEPYRKPLTERDIENLDRLMTDVPPYFLNAMKGLARLEIDPQIYTMLDFWNYPDTAERLFGSGFPDDYDFIYFFETVQSASGPTGMAYNIRNYTHGIGLGIFDAMPGYSVEGTPLFPRFLADMRDRVGDNYEAWMAFYTMAVTHELMHKWVVYWRYQQEGNVMTDHTADPANGGIHYSSLVDKTAPDFNIDLYMMGLIPKEEVNPIHLTDGRYITIDQIIGVEGERWDETTP